jgi:hypothetical protein
VTLIYIIRLQYDFPKADFPHGLHYEILGGIIVMLATREISFREKA